MNTEHIGIPLGNEAVRTREPILETLAAEGLGSLDALTARAMGHVVTDHRSSWVRSARVGTTKVYIKTYDYPTPADRRRGFGRTTFLAKSRARAEWDALAWFEHQGLDAPRGLLVAERRRFGVLRRAVLVTEAWVGEPADQVLNSVSRDAGEALVGAIRAQVAEWHRRGFRDRNLDLRNLIVRPNGAAWSVVKIDSPRWRLRAPGTPNDRLAVADLARLDADLARHGY